MKPLTKSRLSVLRKLENGDFHPILLSEARKLADLELGGYVLITLEGVCITAKGQKTLSETRK